MALLGYNKVCGARSGGGNRLYLALTSEVEDFTLGSEDYSAVSMIDTNVFHEYEFERDTFELKFDDTRENGAFKSVATIEVMLPKLSQTSRDAIQELADNSDCGLIAIAEDANGTMWVVGYTEKHKKKRPLELATNAGTTGKALTDANGDTLTLTCEAGEKFRTFTGTVPVTP